MPAGRFLFFLMAAGVWVGGVSAAVAQTGTKVTLTWTAPGDDDVVGDATLYDVRFSRQPITEANFNQATRAIYLKPNPPGFSESFTIGGLLPGVDYYFAIKTVDEMGNWSPISNLAVRRGRPIGTENPIPEMSLPWPNPARQSARFTLSLPGPRHVRIEAFDLTGRRVRTLTPPTSERSAELVWDLSDEDGRPVGSGVYLVRAQWGDRVMMRRVQVVR